MPTVAYFIAKPAYIKDSLKNELMIIVCGSIALT